jgi:hypothetical protein
MANNFTVGYWYDNDTSTLVEEEFYRPDGLESGGHAVYYFTDTLETRTAAYDYVTAYVSVNGDTNQTNDTTKLIMPFTVDFELVKLQIEENRTDSCRVRAVVRNTGNIPYYNTFIISANINGQTIKRTIPAELYTIGPGETFHLDFMDDRTGNYKKILKSPTRTYTGTGQLISVFEDSDPTNDQTTRIEVVNYFEDVPMATENGLILEQNFPNPFDGTTRIEFAIPSSGNVKFFVTDIVGRPVYESTSYYNEGRHSITFNGAGLASGVYYYGIETGGERRLRKMIVK